MKKNNLKKADILSKIKRLLNKFFHKFHNNKRTSNIEVYGKDIKQLTNQDEYQNIFDKYRYEEKRYKYLLNLQKKFESDMILEDELSDKDKSDLEKLYHDQINELQRSIRKIDIKIKNYNDIVN